MIITMDLSSYEIEQEEQERQYGDEIMYSGWNPEVNQVCEQLQEVQADEKLARAAEQSLLISREDISAAVSEMFQRKMYSYHH